MKHILKLNDVNDCLNAWDFILKDINICVSNIEISYQFLHRCETGAEVHNLGFFQHYRDQAFFCLVIQLDKLLVNKPNNNLSLFKLHSKLKESKIDNHLRDLFNDNRIKKKDYLFTSRMDGIEKIQDEINKLKEYDIVINKIQEYRDRRFAHSDIHKEVPKIVLSEVKNVMLLLNNVINNIKTGFTGCSMFHDQTATWEVTPVMNLCVEQLKIRNEKLAVHQLEA
jgi:hypothetical protein